MSLGAQRYRLLQLMLFDGLRLCPTLFSLGRGLLLSCAATRAFLSMLSGTRPLDPLGLSGVIATLLVLMPPERRVERINICRDSYGSMCPISVSILFPKHAGAAATKLRQSLRGVRLMLLFQSHESSR